MSDSSHHLRSSLERELEKTPFWNTRRAEAERIIINEFKRRAHHYTREVPGWNEDIDWLALMRHHGAPTRLLDWTRSPYVALFFAAQGAILGDGKPAIWILNIDQCVKRACRTVEEHLGKVLAIEPPIETHNLFSICQRHSFEIVFPVEPIRVNERFAIQQGVLLYPGNISKSFDENLEAGVGMDDMIKYEIPRDLIFVIMYQLHMATVSSATLLPGLDGFSASMRELLWLPEYIEEESP
jgi:hypothetical protein